MAPLNTIVYVNVFCNYNTAKSCLSNGRKTQKKQKNCRKIAVNKLK